MWIGNLMLVVINLPFIGVWVKLLTVPYRLLYQAILLFCCVGVYSINNRVFNVVLAAGLGLLGYAFRKAKCEPVRFFWASYWDRCSKRTFAEP